MEKHKFMVSSTPHVRSGDNIQEIMLDVLIALAPAAVVAAYYFGFGAIALMAAGIISAVLFEFLYQKATKQKVTVADLSAAVTGLLIVFNLPASAPLWMPVVGSFFAIILVKQLFGGLGQNFINPALAARAFLLASYPAQMTNWSTMPLGTDAVSSATPLAALKNIAETGFAPNGGDYLSAFIGNTGGCIGETCAAALLLGGLYLIVKKVISWRIPVTYAATVMILTFVIGRDGFFSGYPVYELLVGGFMLGAFFMATDYTTSPVTPVGQIIMGIGCGVLTAVIRCLSGGYPEGVSYSILIMNLAVPLIDRYTKPKIYGFVKKVKKAENTTNPGRERLK